MNYSRLSFTAGLGLILLAHPASAQTPPAKTKTSLDVATSKDKSVAKAEAEHLRKGRQEQARSLLFALGSDARSFRDQRLRARSLARVADALWDVAADQGRVIVKYMLLRRLMPIFEQHAPKEISDAMRGQFEALNSLVSDTVRQSENEWIQKGISPEKQLRADQEQSLLEQIERARTSDERDELYFKLSLQALSKDDMKAREYVSKIEESEFRKRAQAWVDAYLAISAIKKKKVETALELVRGGELTHIQRVWLLTQAAKLLAKVDRDKALSLLDEATAEARRIDAGTPDRPRGLLAIANALILVEPGRAWEASFDAIKAANSTEGFTGEGGALTMRVQSKSLIFEKNGGCPRFRYRRNLRRVGE
jgi:hypothetical protein